MKNNSSAKDTALRCLLLLSGIALTVVGVIALFNGHGVVGAVSKAIGIAAVISGIISMAARIKLDSYVGAQAHFMSADSIILIVIGIIFLNTRILVGMGRLMFVIIGLIMIFHAVESLFSALVSIKNDEGWFIPRIVVGILLLAAGIWVFCNAGRAFTDMAGVIAGIYFITGGLRIINDWIGKERYRKNFSFLDDDSPDRQ